MKQERDSPRTGYDKYGSYSFREGEVISDTRYDSQEDEDRDMKQNKYKGPMLDDLSLDVYKDADLPHRLPPKLLQYDK